MSNQTTPLGYVVVARDGNIIGKQHGDKATAQRFADEWTNNARSNKVDWDYRVAQIVGIAA